jgi:hypothetical protein
VVGGRPEASCSASETSTGAGPGELQIIEREEAIPADEIQAKRIPGVRVAELTGTAAGFEPDPITWLTELQEPIAAG